MFFLTAAGEYDVGVATEIDSAEPTAVTQGDLHAHTHVEQMPDLAGVVPVHLAADDEMRLALRRYVEAVKDLAGRLGADVGRNLDGSAPQDRARTPR